MGAILLTERAAFRGTVAARAASPWGLIATTVVWQIGAHVDAWYHAHWGFRVESFVTWPHALLYGGWLAVAAAALWAAQPGTGAAPAPGARLALAGTALFGFGGVADYAWHTAFGFEASLSTLFSPSHVWLITSAVLASAGVLQAAAAHRARGGAGRSAWWAGIAVALAVGMLFRLGRYMLFYVEPLAADYPAGGVAVRSLPSAAEIQWDGVTAQAAGTSGIILYSVLLALVLVLALRRLRLPTGGLAVVLLWDGVLTASVDGLWSYLPAVVGAALVGELLWRAVRRGALGGTRGRAGYWAIAAAVPTTEFALYVGLMAAGPGMVWPIHLWAGAPIVAGLYAAGAAMLALPPRGLPWGRGS
jgi:hypothetical protein